MIRGVFVHDARRIIVLALFLGLWLSFATDSLAAPAGSVALDSSLQPDVADVKEAKEDEAVSHVFRDMGVVQRKAMHKGGRFLFSSYGSFDLSDGPYTFYSVNTNPGFALSDFFEIYFNYVAQFITSPRSIVRKISDWQLIDGTWAGIAVSKPLRQMGFELIWAPLYGKDSIGIRRIIRSDTFLKFGAARITYKDDTGNKFLLGFGKTFFLSKYFGLRVTVNTAMIQTIVDDAKSYRGMVFLESGLVVYL